jgi:hypothetical protein
MLRKKDRYLRRQEKSSKEIKGLHQRNNQKSKNMAYLRRLISFHCQQKEKVRKLMEFLCTCVNLIQDKCIVQELQYLIKQYELGKIESLLNREVHQIEKRRRTNKELHLNAQIGEYDIDYVVLDLGSEVNVMTKQTWALMGKMKLIYSPIRLRMAKQQAVSPFG